MSIKKTKICIDPAGHPLTQALVSAGLPPNIRAMPPFYLEDSISTFLSDVHGLRPKTITKAKQLDMMKHLIQNPFYAPYLCCITSSPNDNKSKLLTAYIFRQAIKMYYEAQASARSRRKFKDRTAPVWHIMQGGFDNPLTQRQRYDYSGKPSLIIISNVDHTSTAHKIEKVRDALEIHSGIPRIVVSANLDPLTLFNTKFFLNLNACCFLTNAQSRRQVDC